jgi:hypothetical protein
MPHARFKWVRRINLLGDLCGKSCRCRMSLTSAKISDLAVNVRVFGWPALALGKMACKTNSASLLTAALSCGALLGPREHGARRLILLLTAALSCGGPLRPPGIVRAQRVKRSRPLSRVLSWTVIPLAYASPRSSSDLPGSPCGPHVAAVKPLASLFGLAPGGVCRAVGVATRAVRSYRTISPLPAPLARHLGGIFLLHFP